MVAEWLRIDNSRNIKKSKTGMGSAMASTMRPAPVRAPAHPAVSAVPVAKAVFEARGHS